MHWKNYVKKLLVPEKELSDNNFERLKNALVFTKNNLFGSTNNMYLAIDSLIDRNNITGSNNIALKRVNITPCVYDQIYMNKDLIQDKLYHLIVQ